MKISDFRLFAIAFILSILMASPEAQAESQDRPFPENTNPSKRYVFYMHGAGIENKGTSIDNKYYDILDALEAKGFVTIGEVRSDIHIMGYAKRTAKQVRRLIAAGVPPGNITISGHSRGAKITMRVAAVLKEPQVRFIPIAGCGYQQGHGSTAKYKKFTKKLASKLQGAFMIMWEESDEIAGDCDTAMKLAANVTYKNMKLTVGGGHKLFHKPEPSWIDPFAAFAKGE